jgi:hypothetical protein
MHHIALHLTHCIILLLAHIYAYTLCYVESKSKVQAEQAQDEVITNIFLSKSSPGAPHQIFLNLFLN